MKWWFPKRYLWVWFWRDPISHSLISLLLVLFIFHWHKIHRHKIWTCMHVWIHIKNDRITASHHVWIKVALWSTLSLWFYQTHRSSKHMLRVTKPFSISSLCYSSCHSFTFSLVMITIPPTCVDHNSVQ